MKKTLLTILILSLISLSSCVNSDDLKANFYIVGDVEEIGSGESVTFNGSDSEGEIERFRFFSSIDGDLCVGTAQVCEAKSLSNGLHTISLEVREYSGRVEIVSRSLRVGSYEDNTSYINSLSASLSTLNQIVNYGSKIFLDGSESGGDISEYIFKSSLDGELTCSEENSPICETTLKTVGDHTLTLLIKDSRGNIDIESVNVSVTEYIEDEVSSISADLELLSEQTQFLINRENIIFSAYGSSGDIEEYIFQSSLDGTLCEGENSPMCKTDFQTTGIHTITLTVVNSSTLQIDTDYLTVVVVDEELQQ